MSETNREIKDSILSTVTVENFVETFAHGFFERPLAIVANRRWSLVFKNNTKMGVDYLGVYPYFISNENFSWPFRTKIFSASYAITMRSENSSVTFKDSGDFRPNEYSSCEMFIELNELFAEESGFLRNGALTVECEVRVYAITDNREIRRLNLHDPFEGCVRFKIKTFEITFYAKKAMVIHHCSAIAEQIAAGEEEFPFHTYSGFEWFLQMIHGVIGGLSPEDYVYNMLEFAVNFGATDALKRYETVFSFALGEFEFFEKSHYQLLKEKLKTVESLEELKEVIVENNLKELDSEMLKKTVRNFFSFAADVWSPKNSV